MERIKQQNNKAQDVISWWTWRLSECTYSIFPRISMPFE